MKKLIILAIAIITLPVMMRAQNSIAEARAMAVGTVVTVKGIVTNGSELGIIRYFQDNTAGIAAYGSLVSSVALGDSVTITGTLKIYNQLLELDPLTDVTIRSSGNPVPAPIVLSIPQIGEEYEGMLVKVENVTFTDAGTIFTGNKKYEFTANGQSGYIYVKTSQTDIVGQPVPSGLVSIVAECSQFHYSNPNDGYQLLPRTISDIQLSGSIYLTSVLNNSAFTKTSLDFDWSTNIAGTTEMYYGNTETTVTANHASGTGGSATHNLSLSGLSAGQVVWTQAFSVSGTDTAFSGVMPFATISNSTGDIKVYFNTAVDHSYSNGVDAITLPNAIDDTLINYINRAKYSIDLTMYNFNNQGISNVSTALKAAANRGVTVRVIGCGTTANLGIDELAGSAVHVLIGPSSANRTGIMHNKFILFDTESADPNDPIVWTGSTNLTDDQVNLDANNVIIVQDQSLARAFKIEFEEMWGSSTPTPNANLSRFGFTKRNNTPHQFRINDKNVECYFSPTDGVNGHIVETINTTNNDLSIATMLITRNEMANAIADQKNDGDDVNVITNAEGNNGATVNTILQGALGTHNTYDNVSNGILHHKYMIVDQGAPASDPIVWTGSHNWSAAADNDNDENTLVVHDATIANIYYQNFVKRFVDNNGVLTELTEPPTAVNDSATTPMDVIVTVNVLENDIQQAPVTVSIETQPTNGSAFIPFSNPNAISYQPNSGYKGNDEFTYRIAYTASPDLFATAKIYVKVGSPDGLDEIAGLYRLVVYPNPASSSVFNLSFAAPKAGSGFMQLFDLTGKLMVEQVFNMVGGENTIGFTYPGALRGAYLLRISTPEGAYHQRLLFE